MGNRWPLNSLEDLLGRANRLRYQDRYTQSIAYKSPLEALLCCTWDTAEVKEELLPLVTSRPAASVVGTMLYIAGLESIPHLKTQEAKLQG